MAKQVELSQPIAKMLKGLDIAANAVTGTLGPRGRNAFIADTVQPRITNDGKTIADSIILEDKYEELGAWTVRNTSAQTNDDAGDGTTTTTLLLQSIVHQALKRPENPMEVSQSLLEASGGILKAIKAASKEVEDVYKVALTSTEDEALAKMIAEVIGKVGKDGTILVEENNEPKLDFEIVNGYEANVGFMSTYFVNNPAKMIAEYKNIGVFCTEKKIGSVGDITPLFAQFKEKSIRQVVIVAEDIDPTMLGVFVQNKLQGAFNILAIRATGPLLVDIAAATGAKVVSDTTGITFDNYQVDDHMGFAQKVVSSEKKTVFLSDAKSAKEHAISLEAAAKINPNKWEARKAMERVHKLRGGMAVLRVGAPTTLAMGYLKDKADDAVHATQAALEEGVVEGGGMTLWRIAQDMKAKTIGEQILKKALVEPLKKICENAGKDYTDVVRGLINGEGYDAKADRYVLMFNEGIIDPAKVERCAVENAISNAAKFITTHAAIVEAETKD